MFKELLHFKVLLVSQGQFTYRCHKRCHKHPVCVQTKLSFHIKYINYRSCQIWGLSSLKTAWRHNILTMMLKSNVAWFEYYFFFLYKLLSLFNGSHFCVSVSFSLVLVDIYIFLVKLSLALELFFFFFPLIFFFPIFPFSSFSFFSFLFFLFWKCMFHVDSCA